MQTRGMGHTRRACPRVPLSRAAHHPDLRNVRERGRKQLRLPSQLGTAFPYKAGPRGEEPGLGRPRSCHEAGGWDPHSSGAQQWRVRGGGAAGLGWAWDRDPCRGLASLVLSSQGPGPGGSASVNYCFCFFSLTLSPAPKLCVSGV